MVFSQYKTSTTRKPSTVWHKNNNFIVAKVEQTSCVCVLVTGYQVENSGQ